MKKSLFIPDAKVRQMVEHVKNMNNFGSLRETVEEGMLSLMRENKIRTRSFDEALISLQNETMEYLGDGFSGGDLNHKKFFDELNGEV